MFWDQLEVRSACSDVVAKESNSLTQTHHITTNEARAVRPSSTNNHHTSIFQTNTHAVRTMKRRFDSNDAATRVVKRMRSDGGDVRNDAKQGLRKRRRVVRFSEEINQTKVINLYENTWLSDADYSALQERVFLDIRAVCFSPARPGTLLNGTPFSNKPELNPAKLLKRLAQWSRFVEWGRGLENQVHDGLSQARRMQRAEHVRSVLMGQELSRLNSDGSFMHDEFLRLVSEKHSESGRMHALLVGLADEKALPSAQFSLSAGRVR